MFSGSHYGRIPCIEGRVFLFTSFILSTERTSKYNDVALRYELSFRFQ